MTPEILGVIIAAFGGAATFLGGVAALNARMMQRIDARFDRVDARFDRLEARVDSLATDVVGVQVAVARLEGPQPRLLRP